MKKITLLKPVPDPLLLKYAVDCYSDETCRKVVVIFPRKEKGRLKFYSTKFPIPPGCFDDDGSLNAEATRYVEKIFYEKPQVRLWERAGKALRVEPIEDAEGVAFRP